MILTALCGYYQRAKNMPGADIIEPGYAMSGVSVEIVLSPEGKIIAVHSLKELTRAKACRADDRAAAAQRARCRGLCMKPAFLFGIFENPRARHTALRARAFLSARRRGGRGARARSSSTVNPLGSVVEGTNTELLSDPRALRSFVCRATAFLHER